MAISDDSKHFEDYREQTRVKHEILTAYLPAYYHILKGRNKNLVFIDGFAGPGFYTKVETGETFDGSPLRALKLFAANDDFAKKVSTVFIEANPALYTALAQKVGDFYANNPHIRKPKCSLGTFSDKVNEILNSVGGKLAPTFLFVDPCGVTGTSFTTIAAVMACQNCEAFVFFNIDGIRRIAGLPELSSVLVELMGTKERAQALHGELRKTTKVREREQIILSHYRDALVEEIGARYVVAFRVEHEEQRKTSHYFIHATKHPLGFAIMKDVMWRRGHAEDAPGALELRQKSRSGFTPLFDLAVDEIKSQIIDAVKNRPLPASVFYEAWVRRPDDVQCESSYRKLLLELEAENKIEILSKDGQTVTPAHARPRPKGRVTLSKDRLVRLNRDVTSL